MHGGSCSAAEVRTAKFRVHSSGIRGNSVGNSATEGEELWGSEVNWASLNCTLNVIIIQSGQTEKSRMSKGCWAVSSLYASISSLPLPFHLHKPLLRNFSSVFQWISQYCVVDNSLSFSQELWKFGQHAAGLCGTEKSVSLPFCAWKGFLRWVGGGYMDQYPGGQLAWSWICLYWELYLLI